MHDPAFLHSHADVLGVSVSAVNMQSSVALVRRWIDTGKPGYVCMTGVHGVMEAQSDPELRRILNRALVNAPDGMPMTWVGHVQGHREMDRVFGPDFMAAMCQVSVQQGYRIFLYGGQTGVAQQLSESLQERFPGLEIAGTLTPPFDDLTPEQESELFNHVRQSRPHILWVGLSTPKQERFMARYVHQLQVPLLVGVGAAFDFHTGRIRDCSPWVKRAGFQWLHRLMQDPRRLGRRYLRHNPAFLWHIALQLLGFGHQAPEMDMRPPDGQGKLEVRS